MAKKPKDLLALVAKLGLLVEINCNNGLNMYQLKKSRLGPVKRVISVSRSPKEFITTPQAAVHALCVDIAHELGHYLIATAGRRRRPDYGIPENAEGIPQWDLDEAKAVLVEHYLRAAHGLKFKKDPLRDKAMRAVANKWWREQGKNEIQLKLSLFA